MARLGGCVYVIIIKKKNWGYKSWLRQAAK